MYKANKVQFKKTVFMYINKFLEGCNKLEPKNCWLVKSPDVQT